MSYYTTPRRRHSSLFERMQHEINKISKKISQAKQSYSSSVTKPRKSHLRSYEESENQKNTMRRLDLPQPRATTSFLRRRASIVSSSEDMGSSDNHIIKEVLQQSNSRNKILEEENSRLSHRLGRVEAICETQSYRIGYMKAQLRESDKQLSLQKQKEEKETNYLKTLLQHYKSKASKYKKLLKNTSEVSIDLGSDVNI